MDTSWEQSAEWYDRLLAGEGTYQKELILPNLLRLMNLKRGEAVLDLACGQGFFSHEFARRGARVIAVDASQKLIAFARRSPMGFAGFAGAAADKAKEAIDFRVARAHSLPFLKNKTVDAVAIVLALQNMDNPGGVLLEAARVLKSGGTLHVVVNHPAFRIPHGSSWGWDAKASEQYRRIDQYLSESKVKIAMHPGDRPSEHTWSFHRPRQFYFKALNKAGLAVSALEEWNSHKKSEPGPRAKAEDKARKEIPLFLYFAAKRM